MGKMVLFIPSHAHVEGDERIRRLLSGYEVEFVELDCAGDLRDAVSSRNSGVLVAHVYEDAGFALTLVLHELRLKGVSREQLEVVFVLGEKLYKRYRDNNFVLALLHHGEVGVDVITDLDTAIQKVLPVVLEQIKEDAT